MPYGLVLLLATVVSGCGISSTSKPVDEGDKIDSAIDNSIDAEVKPLPSENEASTPEQQVENFLDAAVGGTSSAKEQVKKFLTRNALGAFPAVANPNDPPLTVIRLLGAPHAGAVVGDETPVTIDYQVVGTMTGGLGHIDDIAADAPKQTTFGIVVDEASGHLRIDKVDGDLPPGLLLSDTAITDYYLTQPLYFWDNGYNALVPDLRYVPQTVTRDKRYSLLVDGLIVGPSSWLSGGVQRLPTGTTKTGEVVTGTDGAVQVRLSAQAIGEGGLDAQSRLMYQLQWTLADIRSSQRIDLFVDEKPVQVRASADYLGLNLGYPGSAQQYDIVDKKVVAKGSGLTPPFITTPENADVVSAAVTDQSGVAALVRVESSKRYLQFVTGVKHVDVPQLTRTSTLGRPSFVPATGGTDIVLIPTGGPTGHLLAVSSDGTVSTALHGSIDGVTAAAVSPDGRRVAFVAGGQVYVSYLSIGNNTVTVGSSPRAILPAEDGILAVTWTSESELQVGGPTSMWQVTADGVVAQNESDKLLGLQVNDLVCNPQLHGSVEVFAYTQQGIYSFRTGFAPRSDLKTPFFGN